MIRINIDFLHPTPRPQYHLQHFWQNDKVSLEMITSLDSLDLADLKISSENIPQDIYQSGRIEEQPDTTCTVSFQVESWKV